MTRLLLQNSHQPYYYKNSLYYCRKQDFKPDNPKWLPYKDEENLKIFKRFDTICSIVPCEDGFSFVGGKWHTNKFNYNLFFYDIDFKIAVKIESKAMYGFVSPNLVITPSDLNRGFRINYEKEFTLANYYKHCKITRIVPHALNKQIILVTGVVGSQDRTFLFNLKNNYFMGVLKVNNQDVYKCCFSDDGLYFSQRVGEDFEDRSIYFASNEEWELEPWIFT
jgi:hypothetical protein